MQFRLPLAASLLTVLLVVSGCWDGRIPTYPVTGTVLVDGRPAEGAIVIFVPNSTSEAAERERPFGIADAQGRFNLMTFDPGDGAPAGEYKVLIQWPAPVSAEAARGGGRAAVGPDRLRGKYFNLDKTTLAATVQEQANELSPFELQSR
jgi:hypothetical protein